MSLPAIENFEDLKKDFEAETCDKGRLHLKKGGVLEVNFFPELDAYLINGGSIEVKTDYGLPQGEKNQTEVSIFRSKEAWVVESECTCKYSYRCKHAAALLCLFEELYKKIGEVALKTRYQKPIQWSTQDFLVAVKAHKSPQPPILSSPVAPINQYSDEEITQIFKSKESTKVFRVKEATKAFSENDPTQITNFKEVTKVTRTVNTNALVNPNTNSYKDFERQKKYEEFSNNLRLILNIFPPQISHKNLNHFEFVIDVKIDKTSSHLLRIGLKIKKADDSYSKVKGLSNFCQRLMQSNEVIYQKEVFSCNFFSLSPKTRDLILWLSTFPKEESSDSYIEFSEHCAPKIIAQLPQYAPIFLENELVPNFMLVGENLKFRLHLQKIPNGIRYYAELLHNQQWLAHNQFALFEGSQELFILIEGKFYQFREHGYSAAELKLIKQGEFKLFDLARATEVHYLIKARLRDRLSIEIDSECAQYVDTQEMPQGFKAKVYLSSAKSKLIAKPTFVYNDQECEPLHVEYARGLEIDYDHEQNQNKRHYLLEYDLLEGLVGSLHYNSDGTWQSQTDEEMVSFILDVLPKSAERWEIYCDKHLEQMIQRPEMEINLTAQEIPPNQGSGIDFFKVGFAPAHFHLKDVPVIIEAINKGQRHVRLNKESVIFLDKTEGLQQSLRVYQDLKETSFNSEKGNDFSLPKGQLYYLFKLSQKFPHLIQLNEARIQEYCNNLNALLKTQFEIPQAINAALRDYQMEGYQFLQRIHHLGVSGILADEMGLGKTLQTIVLLKAVHDEQKKSKLNLSSLIVCPSSLIFNWSQEITKFCPALKFLVIYGNQSTREKLIAESSSYDLIITSYPLLTKDIEIYKSKNFCYVVLDEAQKIKNQRTLMAKSVKQLNASHRLAITGTPIENRLSEMWSMFDFLMPGYLGSFNYFDTNFAQKIAQGEPEALNAFVQKTKPFILRRLKAEVVRDLPQKIEQEIYCELSEEEKNIYLSFRNSADLKLSDQNKPDRLKILTAIMRLRQICCHNHLLKESYPQLEFTSSAKFELFFELLDSLIEGGHKVVVFSQFSSMLQLIKHEIKNRDLPFCYLDGSTTNRMAEVDRFNQRLDIKVFLVSLHAGGVGLNLTSADSVILYDQWWNPAAENQAIDRLHRIGQKNVVTAYRLLTRGTIEESIQKLKQTKQNLFEQVVTESGDTPTELSLELLKMLLDDEQKF